LTLTANTTLMDSFGQALEVSCAVDGLSAAGVSSWLQTLVTQLDGTQGRALAKAYLVGVMGRGGSVPPAAVVAVHALRETEGRACPRAPLELMPSALTSWVGNMLHACDRMALGLCSKSLCVASRRPGSCGHVELPSWARMQCERSRRRTGPFLAFTATHSLTLRRLNGRLRLPRDLGARLRSLTVPTLRIKNASDVEAVATLVHVCSLTVTAKRGLVVDVPSPHAAACWPALLPALRSLHVVTDELSRSRSARWAPILRNMALHAPGGLHLDVRVLHGALALALPRRVPLASVEASAVSMHCLTRMADRVTALVRVRSVTKGADRVSVREVLEACLHTGAQEVDVQTSGTCVQMECQLRRWVSVRHTDSRRERATLRWCGRTQEIVRVRAEPVARLLFLLLRLFHEVRLWWPNAPIEGESALGWGQRLVALVGPRALVHVCEKGDVLHVSAINVCAQ